MSEFDFYPFNKKCTVAEDGNSAVYGCDGRHLCGYTVFREDEVPSAWHGNYDADGLQFLAVHGGMTYAAKHDDHIVFGFDCGHCDDDVNPLLKDPVYVMKLTEQMRSQLVTYAQRIEEWRSSDRETRVKIMEEIINTAEIPCDLGFGAMISMLSGSKEFGEASE